MTDQQPEEDEPSDGISMEVSLPLGIVSLVFGIIGLTQARLAWVAVGLGLVALAMSRRSPGGRTFAIIGLVMGVVGAVSALSG